VLQFKSSGLRAPWRIVGDLAVKEITERRRDRRATKFRWSLDELPMLAALGPYTEEELKFAMRRAAMKESEPDRRVAENLRRLGASVEERRTD